jgi:stage II sporulation protein D
MNRTYNFLFTLLILLLVTGPSMADDSIRVLIQEDPGAPVPSKDTESVKSLNGKIFLNGKTYNGDLEIKKDSSGLHIISSIPFEKYVEGVVASESGKEWEIEALKAQAVISRTYAVFHKLANGSKEFHLTSGVLDQVYKEGSTDPLITYAVSETEDEVLTYNGEPVESFYHSICYGSTELPEEVWGKSYPYLTPVECNSKETPYENWQRRFSAEDLEKATDIKGIMDINIASLTTTGRVKAVTIVSKEDNAVNELKATDLRKLLGYEKLPSTDFKITKDALGIVFEGRGWGHGVGLCQWGALEMAREGKDYKEILSHYYPGTIIEIQKSAKDDKPIANNQDIDNKNSDPES